MSEQPHNTVLITYECNNTHLKTQQSDNDHLSNTFDYIFIYMLLWLLLLYRGCTIFVARNRVLVNRVLQCEIYWIYTNSCVCVCVCAFKNDVLFIISTKLLIFKLVHCLHESFFILNSHIICFFPSLRFSSSFDIHPYVCE